MSITDQEQRDITFLAMIEDAQAVLDQHRPLTVTAAPVVIPSTKDSL